MKIRASRISASIARAITGTPTAKRSPLAYILAFFRFFSLYLTRFRASDFATLREEAWQLEEEAYRASFAASSQAGKKHRNGKGKQRRSEGEEDGEEELVPVGDLGYSGSTFFTTADGRFLIKSLPRAFEYEFFARDLFSPYLKHMTQSPQSLLVRITDMVYSPRPSLGGLLSFAPTHHIVMENLLHGKEAFQDTDEEAGSGSGKWETYDLKPSDYFFPERDIADGKLAPESVKAKLVDEFPDKIRVSKEDKKTLMDQLNADTQLLADNSAVDYSLFLIRYPGPNSRSSNESSTTIPSPVGSDRGNAWRSGLDDADGTWTYRCVVLDFFWAKHKTRAKLMTALVGLLNLVVGKGPMSITAEAGEYRGRFLKMVDNMVVGV
ncbi:phosphatidylinositol-4-phosphate 5-Kinase domain-containing protein [Sarocladium implicatum]|nr:phosphatidylinositol-4-phosphate 5-Kinase domain-containing protein [Sarocladium implicatum]